MRPPSRGPLSTFARMATSALMQGDWRGISRHFVHTRTSTQVASHAQKHFIRQLNLQNRKRRSSLFDMAPDPDSVRPFLTPHLAAFALILDKLRSALQAASYPYKMAAGHRK